MNNNKKEKNILCKYTLGKRVSEFFHTTKNKVLLFPPSIIIGCCIGEKRISKFDLKLSKYIENIEVSNDVKFIMKWNNEQFVTVEGLFKGGVTICVYEIHPKFRKIKAIEFKRSKPYIILKIEKDSFAYISHKGDVFLSSFETKKSVHIKYNIKFYDVNTLVISKYYENCFYLTTGFRNKNKIFLVNTNTGRIQKTFQQHNSLRVRTIETFIGQRRIFSPDVNNLEFLLCSIYEIVYLYDSATESIIAKISTPLSSAYSLLIFEKRYLFCGEHQKKSNSMSIFDLHSTDKKKIIDIPLSSEKNWKVTQLFVLDREKGNKNIEEDDNESSFVVVASIRLGCIVGMDFQRLKIENLEMSNSLEDAERKERLEYIHERRKKLLEIDRRNHIDIILKNLSLENIFKVFLIL